MLVEPKSELSSSKSSFNYWNNQFVNDHVLDIYVFCLSEHESADTDGLYLERGAMVVEPPFPPP